MNKETALLTPQKGDELEVLANTISNQQSIVQQIISIRDRMDDQEQRIDQKIARTENLVEKISREVTINYDEQLEISSLVNRKAQEMTKIHEEEEGKVYSNNLFKAWKGLFIRKVYNKLKVYLNVVRYTAIKRENYDRALEFIRSIEYQDFKYRELQPSKSIIEIVEQEKQDQGVKR